MVWFLICIDVLTVTTSIQPLEDVEKKISPSVEPIGQRNQGLKISACFSFYFHETFVSTTPYNWLIKGKTLKYLIDVPQIYIWLYLKHWWKQNRSKSYIHKCNLKILICISCLFVLSIKQYSISRYKHRPFTAPF